MFWNVPTGVFILAIRLMWRSGLLPIIVGKGPSTPADACLSACSIKEAFASKQEAMSAEALFKKRSRQSKLDYIAEMTKKPRTK